MRQICGAISPTKPITPVNARHAEAPKLTIRRPCILNFATSIPRFLATSSPAESVFKSHARISMRRKQMSAIGKRIMTACQLAPHMPPMSQMTMSRRDSSLEIYCMASSPAWKI